MSDAFCKSCQRPVVWLKTSAGRPMICDPRHVTVVTDAGETVRGRVPHWATCPTAAQHKKPKSPQGSLL